MNYKCIVAIKLSKKCTLPLKCTIRVQDCYKIIDLPSQESSFFDIQQFTSEYISLDFAQFGMVTIPIPQDIKEEVEISDSFQLEKLKGKYYILIIKGKTTKFQENQPDQSPLKHYLKSYKARTKERKIKTQTKATLDQTPKSQVKIVNDTDGLKLEIDILRKENELLRLKDTINYKSELDISEKKRKELQQYLQKASQEMVEHSEKLLQQINSQNDDIFKLKKELNAWEIQNQEALILYDQVKNEFEDKCQEIVQLKMDLEISVDLKNLCQFYSKQKNDLEIEFQQGVQKYEREMLNYKQIITTLESKNDELQNINSALLDEQKKLHQAKISQDNEIKALKALIQQQQIKIQLVEQQNASNQVFEKLNQQLNQDLSQKNKDIDKLKQDIDLLQSQINYTQFHQYEEIENDLHSLQKEKIHLEQEQQQMKNYCNQIKIENAKIPLLLNCIETLKSQITAIENSNKPQINVNKLQEIIKIQQDQLNMQIAEIYQLQQQLLSLNIQQDQNELHHSHLKDMMSQIIESNQAYIPQKDDEIDVQLAKMINIRNDKEKFISLFKRQTDGVYQYGSKKIYIKMEQGKILIRQGGGYLSLEEFLSLNEPKAKYDSQSQIVKKQAVNKKTNQMKLVGGQ